MIFLDMGYDQNQFLNFIKEFVPDFKADQREFSIDNEKLKALQLGQSKELNLSILEIHVDSEDSAKRIAITQRTFKIMRRHSIRNAIVAFKYGTSDWRLSLLTSTLKLDEKGRVISEESNPRRYSYLLGPNQKTNTPYKFLIDKGPVVNLEDLLGRFSVEVVNRQFYNSISELFMELVGGERNGKTYPGVLEFFGETGPSKKKQEFAVRLIGRIVFCWFLKEKHSELGVPLIDNDILSSEAVSSHSSYYHNVLEPLFFELLNKPAESRAATLNIAPFVNVPYLNGGLFQQRKDDQYSQNDFTGGGTPGLVTIPDSWFTKLFGIFDQYNFTVDENTSYDVDLSIDPEMLGRIFENLLAEIDPQTGASARKSTGSFYTPREIVDYMVDSSLLCYLKDKTKISEAKLKAVISYGKEDDKIHPLENEEKKLIVDALDELSILDPACGSGAFPIGILQKVVYVLQQVDEDGHLWFEKQIKNIPSIEMQNDLKSKFKNENYDYIRKLGVIRQSIFGVDIQTIATEIAKLRCFLTLIIEEDVDDNKPNRGVHPLPNLDFKFVTANSLIDLPDKNKNIAKGQTTFLEDSSHINALKKIRDEYFTAPSSLRNTLREKFHSLQQDMFMNRIDNLGGNATAKYDRLMRWKPFENEASDWFSPEWMFGLKEFDIVIANPPYIHLEKIKDEANKLYAPLKFETYDKRGDLYSLFFERGIGLLKQGGTLTFITSNKWMRAGYGEKLRNFFIKNAHPIQLIDLGGGVFESATVDTDILILKKESYSTPTKAVAANKNLNAKNISSFAIEHAVSIEFKEKENWIILSPIEQSIKNKIERFGTPLKDWDIKISRGILTGLNEAFIIDENKRQEILNNCQTKEERERTDKIIRPILKGRDIKHNYYDWSGSYVIATHNGYTDRNGHVVPRVNIDYLPSLKRWFDDGDWNNEPDKGSNIHRLSIRTDKGDTPYNLRDCAYMDDFSQQKIIYPETTQSARFFCDSSGFMAEKTCFIMTGKNLQYISSTLSSKMFEFSYKRLFSSVELGERGYQYNKHALEKLPIAITDSDENLTEARIKEIYHFTEEEMNFASSSLNSSAE